MSSEQLKFNPENVGDCLEGRGVNFNLIGNVPDGLYSHPISAHIDFIVSELISNCADKGAKNVYLSFSEKSLRIEDDVVETDSQNTLKRLNSLINKSKKRMSSPGLKCQPNGGFGIFYIVSVLSNFGGDLKYSAKDGRIVTELCWN